MKVKKEPIVNFELDPNHLPPLTAEQQAELNALAQMSDANIDYSDIPKTTGNEVWGLAAHSPFHKPVKQQLTARIDADVVVWLKSKGRGYQSRMNAILRNAMLNELGRK
ncbi:MAG: BrnA antitoxin family protein [Candidatus Competibacteraceae bacterium]|nr:BrnA antitoxin family protein [Candidatus Competibacteraceae bacterium]HRX71462.1 BrnA antitoxin family protein [Candidatus Competibacteraceae bacterium]